MMHIYNDSGKKLSMDELIKDKQGDIWDKILINEWGRLAQGNKHGI